MTTVLKPAWRAAAQTADWPGKPVRIIVPAPAGGPYDRLIRPIAQDMAAAWGQPIVIDNRPSAGNIIGTQAGAQAAPDGYTLTMTGMVNTITAGLHDKLPYDIVGDFVHISAIGEGAQWLVTRSDSGLATLADVLARGRPLRRRPRIAREPPSRHATPSRARSPDCARATQPTARSWPTSSGPTGPAAPTSGPGSSGRRRTWRCSGTGPGDDSPPPIASSLLRGNTRLDRRVGASVPRSVAPLAALVFPSEERLGPRFYAGASIVGALCVGCDDDLDATRKRFAVPTPFTPLRRCKRNIRCGAVNPRKNFSLFAKNWESLLLHIAR